MRAIRFSHNDNWIVSADAGGRVKYWKLNLELVKVCNLHSRAPQMWLPS